MDTSSKYKADLKPGTSEVKRYHTYYSISLHYCYTFMKTQPVTTAKVTKETVKRGDASLVEASAITLGPTGVLTNALSPPVGLRAPFELLLVYPVPVAPACPIPSHDPVKKTPAGMVSMPGGMVGKIPPLPVSVEPFVQGGPGRPVWLTA